MSATVAPVGRPNKTYKSVTVRVSTEVARMLRILAATDGVDVPDWIEKHIGPFLAQRFDKSVRKLANERRDATDSE